MITIENYAELERITCNSLRYVIFNFLKTFLVTINFLTAFCNRKKNINNQSNRDLLY